MDNTSIYEELISTIENLNKLIKDKDNFIKKLINENLEKENMINVLMSDEFN